MGLHEKAVPALERNAILGGQDSPEGPAGDVLYRSEALQFLLSKLIRIQFHYGS